MSEFAKWRRAPGWRVSRRAGELGREGDGKAGNFFRRRRLEAVTRGAEPNAVLSVGTTARLTQPLANFSAPRQAGLFFEARFRARSDERDLPQSHRGSVVARPRY